MAACAVRVGCQPYVRRCFFFMAQIPHCVVRGKMANTVEILVLTKIIFVITFEPFFTFCALKLMDKCSTGNPFMKAYQILRLVWFVWSKVQQLFETFSITEFSVKF